MLLPDLCFILHGLNRSLMMMISTLVINNILPTHHCYVQWARSALVLGAACYQIHLTVNLFYFYHDFIFILLSCFTISWCILAYPVNLTYSVALVIMFFVNPLGFHRSHCRWLLSFHHQERCITYLLCYINRQIQFQIEKYVLTYKDDSCTHYKIVWSREHHLQSCSALLEIFN
jgi:hypothetical protein